MIAMNMVQFHNIVSPDFILAVQYRDNGIYLKK